MTYGFTKPMTFISLQRVMNPAYSCINTLQTWEEDEG